MFSGPIYRMMLISGRCDCAINSGYRSRPHVHTELTLGISIALFRGVSQYLTYAIACGFGGVGVRVVPTGRHLLLTICSLFSLLHSTTLSSTGLS
jgi:hypothetical protein